MLRSAADKAAMQMLFSSVLGFVVEMVSEETNDQQYLCGTALQKALATFLVFIRIALFALSIFNFAVFVYHLPLRIKGLRILLCFLCFLCLCGAIYSTGTPF